MTTKTRKVCPWILKNLSLVSAPVCLFFLLEPKHYRWQVIHPGTVNASENGDFNKAISSIILLKLTEGLKKTKSDGPG